MESLVKILLLFAAVAVMHTTVADPLPKPDKDTLEGSAFEPKEKEEMVIDLEEIAIEAFANGTIKRETVEELIEMFRLNMSTKNFPEYKTRQHFEEEYDEEKRYIFDDDERLPIPNSAFARLPYCAIGELDNGCSAVFIGPYHALTAASCVYNTATNTWRGNYDVIRGRNCNRAGTRMTGTAAWSVTGYTTNHQLQYNYALIITSSTRRSPCWVALGYASPWTERGLDLIGYPTDKRTTFGCLYHSAYSSSCHFSSTAHSGETLTYRCDAVGTYGAPLMSEARDKIGQDLGQRAVYGVHAYQALRRNWNFGPMITRNRFNRIVGWMRNSGYDPLA